MPDTDTERTTYTSRAGVVFSGVRCRSCFTTYAACTQAVEEGGEACCETCHRNETHDEREDMQPAPEPATREVRANGNAVVHRTNMPEGRTPTTLCGRRLDWSVREPRQWRGDPQREIRECAECFPNVVEIVNPPVAGQTAYIVDEDGGTWAFATRAAADAHYSDEVTNGAIGLRAFTVTIQPDHLTWEQVADYAAVHGPGHPLEACTHASHPSYVHTHTVGRSTWGSHTRQPRLGIERVVHSDGVWALFAKGEHLTGPIPVTAQFPPVPNTESSEQPTERESTMPNVPDVGTELFPGLTSGTLSAMPPGTILTIRSRPCGTIDGQSVTFGCKTVRTTRLSSTGVVMTFAEGGLQVVADLTVGEGNRAEIAGIAMSAAEMCEYAESITVKSAPPLVNALVMEYGFYGCAHHRSEVIFVGGGNREGVAGVLVGKVRPFDGQDSGPLTGTVGVREGLLNVNFAQCTPIKSQTTAVTMNLNRERKWALVPCTPDHVTRAQQALQTNAFRIPTAHTASGVAVECTAEGNLIEDPF